MIIRRCAWHRLYVGWPKLMGIVRVLPLWPVLFTDGVCPRCNAEFRRHHYERLQRDGKIETRDRA